MTGRMLSRLPPNSVRRGVRHARRKARRIWFVLSVASSLAAGVVVVRAADGEERLGVQRGGLAAADIERFERGKALFDSRAEIGSAGSALAGLGPVFNMEGCAGCHIRDGRGRPPLVQGEPLRQLVLRLSVRASDGSVVPHPAYGAQLNDRAIDRVPAEGKAFVEYRAVKGRYGDGTGYELAQPHYGFLGMAYGRLDETALVSARVPPQIAGGGLLEAVPEATILAFADEHDLDGDGISGRPNRVSDVETGALRLGRFGWKATQPSLRQQTANAARTDMGITSAHFASEDCPPVQRACVAAGSRGRAELSAAALDNLVTYLKGLDVSPRRNVDDAHGRQGEDLFEAFGCTRCHVPSLPLDPRGVSGAAPKMIAAYSDLMLHDMGEGLADGRPDGLASGAEWRTAPLWGIGRVGDLNRHTRFLHDGRARDLAEAILWHGGEAEAAKDRFRTAPADQRAALIAFLNSL